jgi:hypothetical protein
VQAEIEARTAQTAGNLFGSLRGFRRFRLTSVLKLIRLLEVSSLNARQQKFVAEYVKSGNATQSAIAAGYSENGAEVQGHRLLSNAKISAAVVKPLLKAEVTTERIVAELAKSGFDEKPANDFTWGDKHKALEMLGRIAGSFQDGNAGVGVGLSIILHLGSEA